MPPMFSRGAAGSARRRERPRRAIRRVVAIGSGLVICSVVLAACASPGNRSSARTTTTKPSHARSSRSTTTTAPPTTTTQAPTTTTSTTSPPVTLSPPPVPASGAYLGAWVHPVGGGATSASALAVQMQSLPSFQQSIGRPLAILHVYSAWAKPAPVTALSAVAAEGSIPLLDWGCGIPNATVAAGAADALITSYAQALKAYGKPVFLRWFWEMNLLKAHPACQSAGGAADYVAAWQHIWTIFHEVGATNVAFVWCPAVTGANPAPYYPGDQFVDWIGVDGYDRKGLGATGFTSIFSAFYEQWQSHAKPMMIAETGAMPADQAAYLQGAVAALAGFPEFKALVYFDATGPAASWILTGTGLSAFATLARNQYFSPTLADP
jgi:hypothetical protein